MESLLSLIIVIALVIGFSYLGPILDNSSVGLQQASVSQDQAKVAAGQTQKKVVQIAQQPGVFVDTYITAGPEQGEIIEETNKVVFEFDAKVYPEQTKGKIYFETKIEGLDTKWIRTSAKKRIVNFPAGPKQYTFLVRGKINGFIDLTPAETTFRMNLSPYFNKVKIASVKPENSSSPSLITLSTNLKEDERINITNWYIEGQEGKIIIPQGVENYYHYYNSAKNEDIFIIKGDRIYLSAGFNPLGRDRNFRLNKCMGYLTNDFDFPVSFSKTCPRIEQEQVSHLEPCCQQFLTRLRGCQIPDYSKNANISSDPDCIEYISENLNNIGCFKNHSQDKDFLKNNWYIYLNDNDIVAANYCDTLYLRDEQGFLVDEYSYGQNICK